MLREHDGSRTALQSSIREAFRETHDVDIPPWVALGINERARHI